MLVKELLNTIDSVVPFSWAEEWDNSGLIAGDPEAPVKGIAICLDPDIQALEFTAGKECSVLVSHHPLIFSPLKRIDVSSGIGETIAFALKHNISVISMHTNWDSSPKGVNAAIASGLGLESVQPLVPSCSESWGLGAVGTLPSAPKGQELGKSIRSALKLSRVDFFGDPLRPIRKLALCGGSGGSFWTEAKDSGADAFFTSDVKYHERLEALRSGLCLFTADHGEVESFSLEALALVVSGASGIEPSIFRKHSRAPLFFD
jgi:dinuclear metal center YbgI/SA1388 family protein